MAKNTDLQLQKQVIYSIYVRNHTKEGTFSAIIPDLDRIKDLGTDIIWFLPIHPIGVVGAKGIGCPYANKDYRTVNPAYGSMEDFKTLVREIHARDMKVMIDVVYNHTSPDSTLTQEHPEFFYHDEKGQMGNKMGDWSDVVDLDYQNHDLWAYQIKSLCMWAGIVDGFRCDVASFVPVEFWKMAREAVSLINPDCIWLAETVHSGFGAFARRKGVYSARDTQVYEAFDIEYAYDIFENFQKFLKGEGSLSTYAELLNMQECIYPANYNKMRYLENHDQPRIAQFIKDEKRMENYTAMTYFLKGTTLLYAGQEYQDDHLPSLFAVQPINRHTGKDISALLKKLYRIKQEYLEAEDAFWCTADDQKQILLAQRYGKEGLKFGAFCLGQEGGEVKISFPMDIPDGKYRNLLDNQILEIKDQTFLLNGPVIAVPLA